MGKKDATGPKTTGTKAAPVDLYRKQIGKQDYKKSKKEIKSMKGKADALKSSTHVKDMLLIVTSGLFLIVGLYIFLYWNLNKQKM